MVRRSPFREQSKEPAFPTTSFIIICLAGGLESGQTEQSAFPQSFFLLWSCTFACSVLSICCHFLPLSLSLSLALSLSLFLSTFNQLLCPMCIFFHLFIVLSVFVFTTCQTFSSVFLVSFSTQ